MLKWGNCLVVSPFFRTFAPRKENINNLKTFRIMEPVFILSIHYASKDMDDSGIDAYPFSTLEKAKDAMKKDVEQWKRDMGNTLLHWTFVEDEEEVDCYEDGYYDENHFHWVINKKEIDGKVKPWFIDNQQEDD